MADNVELTVDVDDGLSEFFRNSITAANEWASQISRVFKLQGTDPFEALKGTATTEVADKLSAVAESADEVKTKFEAVNDATNKVGDSLGNVKESADTTQTSVAGLASANDILQQAMEALGATTEGELTARFADLQKGLEDVNVSQDDLKKAMEDGIAVAEAQAAANNQGELSLHDLAEAAFQSAEEMLKAQGASEDVLDVVQRLGDVVADNVQNTEQFGQAMTVLTDQMEKARDSSERMNESLNTGKELVDKDTVSWTELRNAVLQAGAAFVAATGARKVISEEAGLEKATIRAEQIFPEVEAAELQKRLDSIGLSIGKSQQEVAEGVVKVRESFGEQADAFRLFQQSADLAAASLEKDLNPSIDVTHALVNLMNDDSEKAVESINALADSASKHGAGSMRELGNTLHVVQSSLQHLHPDVRTTLSLIAALRPQFQTSSQAAQALNFALRGMGRDSEPMRRILKGLGEDSFQAAVKHRGLAGAMEAVRDKAHDLKINLNTVTGSYRGMTAEQILSNKTFEDTRKLYKEITPDVEKYREDVEKGNATIEASMGRVRAAFEGFRHDLSGPTVVAVKLFADAVVIIRDAFVKLPEPVKTALGVLSLVGGALAGTAVAAGILATAFKAIGFSGLAAGFASIQGTISGVGAAILGVATGPIGITVAAIAGLAAIFYSLRDVTVSLGGEQVRFGSIFTGVWKTIAPYIKVVWELVKSVAKSLGADLVYAAKEAAKVFAQNLTTMINWAFKLAAFIELMWHQIPVYFTAGLHAVRLVYNETIDWLIEKTASWSGRVKDIFEAFVLYLAGDYKGALAKAMTEAVPVADLKSRFANINTVITGEISEGIGEWTDITKTKVYGFYQDLIKNIKTATAEANKAALAGAGANTRGGATTDPQDVVGKSKEELKALEEQAARLKKAASLELTFQQNIDGLKEQLNWLQLTDKEAERAKFVFEAGQQIEKLGLQATNEEEKKALEILKALVVEMGNWKDITQEATANRDFTRSINEQVQAIDDQIAVMKLANDERAIALELIPQLREAEKNGATNAREELQRLIDKYREHEAAVREDETFVRGWADESKHTWEEVTNAAKQGAAAYQFTVSEISSTLSQFFQTGKLDWKKFVSDVAAYLATYAAKLITVLVLQQALNAAQKGGNTNWAGILTTVLGAVGGGVASGGAAAGTTTIANYTNVGGASGFTGRFASGGTVRARQGGSLVRLGEGGEDEVVQPMSAYKANTNDARRAFTEAADKLSRSAEAMTMAVATVSKQRATNGDYAPSGRGSSFVLHNNITIHQNNGAPGQGRDTNPGQQLSEGDRKMAKLIGKQTEEMILSKMRDERRANGIIGRPS